MQLAMKRGICFVAVFCAIATSASADPGFMLANPGYTARPCGFDMDRDGIIGEVGQDDKVGDGVTADPDGDGVNEWVIYVDADTGSDTTGNGTAGNPLKTIQLAMDSVFDSGNGAEWIICISGVFNEEVTIKDSGVPGYYVRDGFQFPDNPLMLIGWDKDGDGEYPPYDTDDVAVIDGRIGATLNRAIGIQTDSKRSYIEIAHLTIRNFGGSQYSTCGALKLFHWGGGLQSHIYVHDVEMESININAYASSVVTCSFWGGPMTDVAIINNLVDEYGSFFCRGSPPAGAGRFRFQNLTLNMLGPFGGKFVTGWKLWGQHNGVEILDNVINANAEAWMPVGNVSGVAVCQAAQDYVIRGNLFIDTGVTIQPFASGYPQGRKTDNILIDRNVFLRTYTGWDSGGICVSVLGSRPSDANEATDILEDATITNNFFTATTGYEVGIRCETGNNIVPQTGTLTIAGNTIYGPFEYESIWGFRSGSAILLTPKDVVYKQQNYVIKNNVIANTGSGDNIELDYAPTGLIANGNIYDPSGQFRWDETQHWVTLSFSQWQAATGQDANSKLAVPTFINAPDDLHLSAADTVAIGFGVDITAITDHDFDGDPRSAATPTAGADVVDDTTPPTIITWHSAADHGRGVGESLLIIADDGSFCEPRSSGVSRLIVELSEPIAPASIAPASVVVVGRDANGDSVYLGAVVISTSLRDGDTKIVVEFSPALPDYARYLVRLDGVSDAAGNPTSGDTDRIITALCGDITGDLRVNTADLSAIRGSRTKLINAGLTSDVRADLTCDGRVNVSDLSQLRPSSGNDAAAIADPTP